MKMKKRKTILFATVAAAFTVLSAGSVRKAFCLDTKIAYADPTITYLYGSDGTEHAALNNFYPHTRVVSNPSDWNGSAQGGASRFNLNLGLSKKALNECKILETQCEENENNMCPFSMTGVFAVTEGGEIIQVWNNYF